MKKLFKVAMLFVVLVFSVTMFACKDKTQIQIVADDAKTSVYTSETLQLNATVTPETTESILWSVSGLLDCSITQDGLLTVGNVAGEVTVKAEIASKKVFSTYKVTVLERLNAQMVIEPAEITLTYGDKLTNDLITDAVVEYEGVAIDGVFSFNNADQNLEVGTHQVQTTFNPSEACYNSIVVTVEVMVEKRPITVRAIDRTMSWGDQEPSLIYNVLTGELVGNDVPTGTLAREPGDSIGEYEITQGTLDFGNNYLVTFISGIFNITKATAEISITDLTKTYNGEIQKPTITVTPIADYTLTFNQQELEGVKNAGIYEVVVSIDNENISGTQTETFTINKLSLAVTATNTEQEYSATGNVITINTVPSVSDLIITYKNDNYESTIAPIEAGEFMVLVSQEGENYILDATEFTFKINPNGYFAEEVNLFAREQSESLTYDISNFNGEISKIVLAGTQLADNQYEVSNHELIIDGAILKESNGSDLRINVYTEIGLYIADVYVVDYMITSENWKDFLTNTGKNALTKYGLTSSYILMTDITYGEDDHFLGIGRKSLTAVDTFKGVFDGNGHTITNWTARALVNGSVNDVITKGNAGFIGIHSGVIRNVGFNNLTLKVHGAEVGHYFAGGIVGAIVGGTISNCYINGATIHAYCEHVDSVATADNSSAGVVFAVTGNAPETAPSIVENVIVYGEINIVCRQEKWIRGVGQASATTGRYLIVRNVYVTAKINTYLYGNDNPLETMPITTETRAHAKVINTDYYEISKLKVGADDEIYQTFDKTVWSFVEGSLPTLKINYEN